MDIAKSMCVQLDEEVAEVIAPVLEEVFQMGFQDGTKAGFQGLYPDAEYNDLANIAKQSGLPPEAATLALSQYVIGYNAGYVRGVSNRMDVRNVMGG